MPRNVTPEPGPLTKEIASTIKGRMAKFDVSQTELAKQVGVNQSQLSKMIRGVRAITIDHLEIMCAVLDMKMEKVVGDAESACSNRGEWPVVTYLVMEGTRQYPTQPSS